MPGLEGFRLICLIRGFHWEHATRASLRCSVHRLCGRVDGVCWISSVTGAGSGLSYLLLALVGSPITGFLLSPTILVYQVCRQTTSFIEISIKAGKLLGGKHEACFVLEVAGIEPMPNWPGHRFRLVPTWLRGRSRGIGQVADIGRNIGQVVKHSRNIGSLANQMVVYLNHL